MIKLKENLTPYDRVDYIYWSNVEKNHVVFNNEIVNSENYILIAIVKVPSHYTVIAKNNFTIKEVNFNKNMQSVIRNED